jgi:hypothetical protein
MDMRKRILTKICSSPPYQWVVRKIGIAMLRRAAKAPEVQERIKALSATAPNTQQRFQAHFEYLMAVGNELAKSKFVKFDGLSPEVRAALEAARAAQPPPPPEATAQPAPLVALLGKVENGNATAIEIEEFRRLAAEVMRDTRISLSFMKRIEAALSLLERP